jgi:hypothetical protein
MRWLHGKLFQLLLDDAQKHADISRECQIGILKCRELRGILMIQPTSFHLQPRVGGFSQRPIPGKANMYLIACD